jgi:hypothetical protein
LSLDVLRAAPGVREILDGVRQWRARRSAKRKESLKAQIVHILGRSMSRSATVAYVSEDALGHTLKISASELRPLLDELVLDGRIFHGFTPRTYTISRWKPNPRNLYP